MERPFPAYIGDAAYVFVCYAHEDAEVVYPELQRLHDRNVNIWYDEGISPGREWTQALADAIEGSSQFLYFVSQKSVVSRNCRNEIQYAAARDKPVVAVHLEPTELPGGLELSIGLAQAVMKYELSEADFERKMAAALVGNNADFKPSGAQSHYESQSGDLNHAGRGARAGRRWSPSRLVATAAVGLAALLVLFVGRTEWLPMKNDLPVPTELWQQLTNFPDSVSQPALSPDGRILTFIRGGGSFVTSGQIYSKLLPNGTPVPLTEDNSQKMSPAFSPDGSRIAYTVVSSRGWETWRVETLGGHPGVWLPNASGLVWTDEENLLFSEMIPGEGIHMKIVAAHETRAEARDIYVPESINGMAHRSAASPDGAWAIVAEMVAGPWVPCRLVPLRGTALSRQVGPPEGGCTFAAWSPDGEWMYFNSNSGGANHIWRQGFPDGDLQQITSGATEQEGIAVSPDGDSLITAITLKKSSIWISDKGNVRAVSSEGYAFDPEFTPDGQYLLFRVLEGTDPVSNASELWIADLRAGRTELFLPGFSLFGFNAYDISANGNEVVIAAPDLEGRSRLWLAPLDRSTPPRQVPNVVGDQPFFGADDEIFFRATDESVADGSSDGSMVFVFRVKRDGTGFRRAIERPVSTLEGLSPDGAWFVAHTEVGLTQAFPLEGGEPIDVYPGTGTTHKVSWTSDGRFLLLPDVAGAPWLEAGAFGHTSFIPIPPGQVFPDFPPEGYARDELMISTIPGVKVIDSGDVAPGTAPDIYAYSQQTVQRNLYRIPLP